MNDARLHPIPSACADWQREVFPHTSLQQLDDDLWTVTGRFPQSRLPRTMVVHRYGGDRLLLHSVVALEEASMRQLESFGQPGVMVIPHWDHWAHVVAFKRRYPCLKVVCPRASRARVEQRLPVDETCEAFFPFHGIRFHVPPGIDPVEGVLEIPMGRGKRTAVVMNDLITNVAHRPGFSGFLLRITGSSGGPRLMPLVRRQLKVQRATVADYLMRMSRREDIGLVTTSHGAAISTDIPQVLQRIARDLRP